MKLRLKASFVGVGFTRAAGSIVTVGEEVTATDAERLVKAGYAEIVRAEGDDQLEHATGPALPPSQASSPQVVSADTPSDDGARPDDDVAEAAAEDPTVSDDDAGPNAAAGDEADSPKPAKKKRTSNRKAK